MSYDLSVYCTEPFEDRSVLPEPERWTASRKPGFDDETWTYEHGRWLINTGPSAPLLEEDIPEEVTGALPGIAHLVELSMEPLGAPKTGYAMLRRTARAIARTSRGVILDQQDGSLELPSGIKTYLPPTTGKEERCAVLKMTWWFEHARVREPAWIEGLLDLLESHLPQAMPRRYGLFEPAKYRYDEAGRAHFVDFLVHTITDSPLWMGTRPVYYWSFSVESACGWRTIASKTQYRCNSLSLTVEAAALQQPGWPLALRRAWREVSLHLDPFFGDVRTLAGYTGRFPRLWSDERTEHHPVCTWWWKGVPKHLGHAAVVGKPYLELWPQLAEVAERRDGLLFLSAEDWSSEQDAVELVGQVPPEIAQPFLGFMRHTREGFRQWAAEMIYPESYPEVFPFGELPPGVKRWDGELPPELREKRRSWWPFARGGR